ncbi:uncharacterized protein RB166_010943 [Leptodactylus fuscus]|uniref:uncharacterized protein LOC142209137 n=1 Tax=Leptodactylus fuscus TaxID=238119 RepID=UPI003F4E5A5F
MAKNRDRHKSIINGCHMKDVQQNMDAEYKAHLRHQEHVRENTERLREKQAASQRASNLLNAYSARTYSKPWQSGMVPKLERPAVSGFKERQNQEPQYKSTVSKLPAIKKDKDVTRKKTVYNPSMVHETHRLITVSQPRITAEKKRLHVHQLSTKPSITCVAEDTPRSKNAFKLQSKVKEPKRPVKPKKTTLKEKKFTPGAITNLNSTQHPYVEHGMALRYDVDHHDPAHSSPLNAHEFTEEPQTLRRPSSSSWSHLGEPENVFNGQPQININEDDNAFDEDVLSYISDISLPLATPTRSETSNTSLHSGGSVCPDSAEKDSDNEEQPHTHRDDNEVNAEMSHSTLHGVDVCTVNNSYCETVNLGPVQDISPMVTDQSPASTINPRDTLESPRSNASITQSHYHEIMSPNTNVQNCENYVLSQPTLQDSGDREMDRPSRDYSTNPNAPGPLRLSLSSTAPHITLLRENLDLVIHTLSMQRQSERRSLENSVLTSQNKEAKNPKADPEKLKKIRESLLQEDSEEEGDLCRICLMGGESTENHLIAPCQCSGSLKYVHTECMKKWLLAKIKSGAELNMVRTCEMCKEKVECEFEGFNLREHYRKHQETQASLNPSLYLVLLLHLYQQRYEELLHRSHTQDRMSEFSRRFLNLSLGRHERRMRQALLKKDYSLDLLRLRSEDQRVLMVLEQGGKERIDDYPDSCSPMLCSKSVLAPADAPDSSHDCYPDEKMPLFGVSRSWRRCAQTGSICETCAVEIECYLYFAYLAVTSRLRKHFKTQGEEEPFLKDTLDVPSSEFLQRPWIVLSSRWAPHPVWDASVVNRVHRG